MIGVRVQRREGQSAEGKAVLSASSFTPLACVRSCQPVPSPILRASQLVCECCVFTSAIRASNCQSDADTHSTVDCPVGAYEQAASCGMQTTSTAAVPPGLVRLCLYGLSSSDSSRVYRQEEKLQSASQSTLRESFLVRARGRVALLCIYYRNAL